MIHRLIDSLCHVNHTSGFDTYLRRLQRDNRAGHPSVEDAKRDYSAFRGFAGNLLG